MEISISHEEVGSKGRYVALVSGCNEPGELTYSRMSPTLIIVDHTFIPDSLRGMGVGAAMAKRVVETAKELGFKIIPLCPFFKLQPLRHPEWADIIQG